MTSPITRNLVLYAALLQFLRLGSNYGYTMPAELVSSQYLGKFIIEPLVL